MATFETRRAIDPGLSTDTLFEYPYPVVLYPYPSVSLAKFIRNIRIRGYPYPDIRFVPKKKFQQKNEKKVCVEIKLNNIVCLNIF